MDMFCSPFGAAFFNAAERSAATWNPGTFDSSSITISKEHLTKFLVRSPSSPAFSYTHFCAQTLQKFLALG